MKTYIIFFLVPLCFFFLLPIDSKSQELEAESTQVEYNYSRFKSTFELEFGETDMTKLVERESNYHIAFKKTKLPSWVEVLPVPKKDVVYALGISDPGMQKDSAMMLAIIRAKSLCSLLNHSTMNGLSDYFIEEKDLTSGDILAFVYKEFSKIESSLVYNQGDFKILNDTFTNNKEAIVLVSLNLSSKKVTDTYSIDCLVEVSSSHINKNKKETVTYRSDFFSICSTPSNNNNENFYYVVKKKDKQLAKKSFYTNNPFSGINSLLSYSSTNNSRLNDYSVSCSLEQGLWYALSSILLQSYILNFSEKDVLQSGLTDSYPKISKDINRTLSSRELSADLLGIIVHNNTLYLDIQFKTRD